MSEVRDIVAPLAPRVGNGPAARKVYTDTVSADTGMPASKVDEGVENDTISDVGTGRRPMKESTQKLLDKLAEPPADDDVDTSETAEAAPTDPDDVGLVEGEAPAAEAAAEGETVQEQEKPAVDQHREYVSRLETANRQLTARIAEMEGRPKEIPTSERYKTLAEAESGYADDTVGSLRKYLSVVLDAPPDSKIVDDELSGLLTDLTARELKVPLEPAAKAVRDAALAKLALARDKKERKAEAEAAKPPPSTNQTDEGMARAATYIGNRLNEQRDGKSYKDQFPLLMTFAETIDGMKPERLIAEVIKREVTAGTINASADEDTMIVEASKMVEAHYNALAERFTKVKTPKTDTTKSGEQTATAAPASKEQRQVPATRTITNASASVAPATSPKMKKQEASTGEKTRKDFPSDKAWREHLLKKHMPD